MMRRSLLTCLFALVATTTLGAPPPINPADAVAFMNALWNRAAELLNDKTDPRIRQARFRQVFHEDFDGVGIARFVLGQYWRSASEEERREFVKLFEDYVVSSIRRALPVSAAKPSKFAAAAAMATG
jgi:phospholipid transport system substrate-binding protein